MGFGISGPGNAFIKVSDVGLNAANNMIDNVFDLENPDGIQSRLQDNIVKNSLKSFDDATNIALDAISGKNSGVNKENDTTTGAKYYTDEVQSEKYKVKEGEGEAEGKIISLGERPYSLFNKFSLVNYRGTPLNPEGGLGEGSSKAYNKIDPTTLTNPTVSKIIDMTSAISGNSGYTYQYSDFALAKYFGKIPNNQMITLRRFAFPCPDDIISPENGMTGTVAQPDIARAITWMGEDAGNPLNSILKFSVSYAWKEDTAEVDTVNSQKKTRSGKFGQMINNSTLLTSAINAAEGTDAWADLTREANAGYDSFKDTYPNHVYGPLNVIKQVVRRDQGLTFEQEFTLKFEYELRDLSGANGKIVMLDLLSNILALTYSNAPFWGGAVRYIGDGSVAKPLGNIAALRGGDYSGFLSSVISDFTGQKGGNWMDKIVNGAKGFLAEGGPGKMLDQFMQGSLFQMFNTPAGGQAAASLLTGDPTGQWHLTIGNPLNPIAVIGNLTCQGADISFSGGMGVDDFPESLIVEIKLKPGRPRDKAEIETMFNSGRGRFYLQPADEADINKTLDVSAYGNKDRAKDAKKYSQVFRKLSNG